MVKRLLLLVSLLGALPALAQHPAKPDPTQLYSLVDGKTIVKTNPFSDLFGNLNLKVERILARGLSAQLSVYYTSKEYYSLTYDGRSTLHGYGIGIGAQWLLGRRKNIVLDWYIFGVGRGTVRGSLDGTSMLEGNPWPAGDHTEEEALLRRRLYGVDDGTKYSFDDAEHRVKVTNIKHASYLLDMGLSIGFRF